MFSSFFLFVCLQIAGCYVTPKEKTQLVKTYHVDFENNSYFVGYSEVDKSKVTNHVSKIDKDITYGGGIDYTVPDSLINKTIRVIVKSKVRNEGWNSFGHAFVVGLFDKEKVNAWWEINMDDFVEKKGEWNDLSDSVQISSDRNTTSNAILKVFGYNGSKFDYMEYDDINIEIKIIQ